ncbi:MAG: adenylate/guanylate cyclase domain-containing protein [Alphaproteobacteria bacterium]
MSDTPIATAPKPHQPRHQASLTLTLAVSIGLLVLVSVGSVLWIGLGTSRRNTLDLLNVQSAMLVGDIEAAIRNHLDPVAEQAEFIHDLVASGALDPADIDHMTATMLGTLAAAPQIMATVYWDTNRQKIIAFRSPDLGMGTQITDDSQNPAAAQVLAETANASEPKWGPLRFDDLVGETFVNLITPLRRNGKVIGTLGTAVGMRELSFLMAEIGLSLEATPFILQGEDQVLAHPFLTSRHDDLSVTSPLVSLPRIGDLTLANIATREPVRGFATAAAQGVEVAAIENSGGTQIIYTKKIAGYSDGNWLIGAYLPLRQVDNEVRRLREAALAGLAMLILAMAAAILLARFIARPIRRVAASANRVAALQLHDVTPLPGSYIREINEQATAFNAMLAGLRWFETYVPRRLVARLMASEGEQAESDERELTVMFTDIVGFTALSESMSAGAIKELLNDHFTLLGAAIEAEGGTIDKYIGDALMAFWGAPDHMPDHAVHACRAAKAIAAALTADNIQRRRQGKPLVRIRIGIHTGTAVVGNIGAPGRINYTVVGDTVNTGQRLEALGKDLHQGEPDTFILLSGTTAQALADTSDLVPLGEYELSGKRQAIEVFQLATRARSA